MTKTAEQTKDLGRQLAAVLRAGDLIVLSGPLGAGKTALTQGIGDGLHIRGAVTSPTFVISVIHPPDKAAGGTLPLVHADAYRLGSIDEIDDLDLDADLADSVTVVEWGEGLVERLAQAHLLIRIQPLDNDERVFTMTAHGGDWRQRLALLGT